MFRTRRILAQSCAGLPPDFCWDYEPAEILADGIMHGIGLLFAVIGAGALVVLTRRTELDVRCMGHLTYAAGLLLSFGLSAAYNLWPISPTKWMLRRFDHVAIYLLIAATTTALLTSTGYDPARIVPLSLIWLVAFGGGLFRLLAAGRLEWLALALYFLLGWACLLLVWRFAGVPSKALDLIAAGGLIYVLGIGFLICQKLRFHNAVWHAIVLLGAVCQYFGIVSCL